jgi:putative ABC transport system permease protein
MKTVRFRTGLLAEILTMAVDTLRTNKLRSALTVLGVVIGVTSIVGMTALIRGFGDQMEALIRQMGSDTIYVAKFSISSFAAGKDFMEVMKRPNIVEADAKAIKASAPSAMTVSMTVGGDGPASQRQRVNYRDLATKAMELFGASSNFPETNYIKVEQGRFFTEYEVSHRRNVAVLGYAPGETLFSTVDPIGKAIRISGVEFTVVGVMGKRPNPFGGSGADEFVAIPITTYDKLYKPPRFRGYLMRFLTIAVVPYPGVPRNQIVSEVEEVMRVRHHLKLDEENDFDILTSDTIMRIFDQFTQAIVLALVVISSIALMVGGIGVMAIMTISVTERTREIGVRKALGAQRRDILWQFLLEAVFLTSLGGLLGIALGSGIGFLVHFTTGFPVSLPWWSFALGVGFSATVGIFFGLWPAFKAARLDPIEALRYE